MTSAGGIAELERLRDAAVAAVSEVRGVDAILGFGSLAAGVADEYSDVDLEVISRDPQAVAPQVYAALRSVGDLSFVYPFKDEHPPDGMMVFFGEFGYFNKLDIGVVAETRFAAQSLSELFMHTPPDRRPEVVSTARYVLHDRRFSDAVLTGLRAIKYMKRNQWLPANHLYRSLIGTVMDRFVALVLDEPNGAHVYQLLRLSRSEFDQRGRLLAVAQQEPSEAAVLELMRLLRHTSSLAPTPSDNERNFLRRALTFLERQS